MSDLMDYLGEDLASWDDEQLHRWAEAQGVGDAGHEAALGRDELRSAYIHLAMCVEDFADNLMDDGETVYAKALLSLLEVDEND